MKVCNSGAINSRAYVRRLGSRQGHERLIDMIVDRVKGVDYKISKVIVAVGDILDNELSYLHFDTLLRAKIVEDVWFKLREIYYGGGEVELRIDFAEVMNKPKVVSLEKGVHYGKSS